MERETIFMEQKTQYDLDISSLQIGFLGPIKFPTDLFVEIDFKMYMEKIKN
jgi:hypothetical protein